jgi:hypothetical protein
MQRFVTRTPPPPPPPSGGDTSPTTAPGVSAAAGGERTRGAFTITETGIVWTCTRCETVNPLDASVCSVCGTTFADVIRPPDDRPVRDPNTVALYSLFFPGAGHWYLGLTGQAVARGVLSVWVVLVAVLAGVAGSVLMAVVFGLAALGLWIVAAHDAYREARHEPTAVILKGRTFLYLVLGLLLLMVVLLVAAGIQAGRQN